MTAKDRTVATLNQAKGIGLKPSLYPRASQQTLWTWTTIERNMALGVWRGLPGQTASVLNLLPIAKMKTMTKINLGRKGLAYCSSWLVPLLSDTA